MYHKLFVPSHKSKKRSLLSNPKSIVLYITFLFLLSVILHFSSGNPKVLGYATDISVNELLDDTNKYREDVGQKGLVINDKLSKAAAAKAKDMFEDNYWAHIAPDGTKPWDFIRSYDYKYIYAGENLAVDFSDSGDVVEAWYESPSHRENLLSKDYTEVGFSIMNGELQGRKTTLVVQMFGKPRVSDNFLSEVGSKSLVDNTGIEQNKPAETEIIENDSKPVQKAVVSEILDKSGLSKLNTETQLRGSVLNANDIFSVSRYISIILGGFVAVVFALDGYYVRKFGILRITGHTFLHVAVLMLALFAIWYTNIGLVL